MRRHYSILLALILLMGQASLLAHEYDFAVHKHGSSCSVCLHGTPLLHAAVGSPIPLLPTFSCHTHFFTTSLAVIESANIPYCARAPPVTPLF